MTTFTLYPAIDLRQGRVVRLKQGDPGRQTVYADDPAAVARRWLEAGARWLHVVNLDGAFGEEDAANRQALAAILSVAANFGAHVQFGGGMRSLEAVGAALGMGVTRVVLGTVAVERPEVLDQALARFGPDRVVAGVDARDGLVRVRGWQKGTELRAVDLATRLAQRGLRWLVFTDVARDGLQTGPNVSATVALARATGLQVIASGGVRSLEDLRRLQAHRDDGIVGVIIGRALYEGNFSLTEAIRLTQGKGDGILGRTDGEALSR